MRSSTTRSLRRYFAALLFLAALTVTIDAQSFQTIHDGVEYAEDRREIAGKLVSANLLRLDLSKVRLDVVHAMDAAIGTERTSSIAKRHGAFAAVNAGFFRLDNSIFAGDAAGVLKIDGRLLSESHNGRIALGIINGRSRTEVVFGHINTSLTLRTGSGKTFPISGINRERKANEIVLFTREFSRTTLTDLSGSEFVVRTAQANGNYGRMFEVRSNNGSTVIPASSFVISASGRFQAELEAAAQNRSRNWSLSLIAVPRDNSKARAFADAEDIVAGVPQLINNGMIDVTWEGERSSRSFADTRHPRTAVALLKDGKFLMITVDGRSETSAGIGLDDLAKYLLELGAVEAMNLDGGGSTTMWVDGKVVNKPSDQGGERRVSDALLVFPRKPPAK